MGVVAAFLSAFFSGAKDLVSKRLAFQLDGNASSFASFAFALPYYILLLGGMYLLGVQPQPLTRAFLTYVVLRALTDVFAEGMKMHAIARGDISVVASFAALSPLFLLIVAPLLTDDWPSITGALAVFVVVGGGLLLVYRPSTTGWGASRAGILLAIGASLFFALNSCFDRLTVLEGTPVDASFGERLASATMAGYAMTLVSGVFLLPFGMRKADQRLALRSQWGGLMVRGLLEVAFMVAKLSALQFLQPAYVMCIQRLSVIVSILGGRVFFKEMDFGRRLAAGTLVVAGVFWIGWKEAANEPPPGRPAAEKVGPAETNPLD
jgi:drug/metabolite transporter (DMT)-like permease